jgi:hypothetical protein
MNIMSINTNQPQFRYLNNTITNDDSIIEDIPIGEEIVLPERVSFNDEYWYDVPKLFRGSKLNYKEEVDSETYGYDIIEGVLVVGYSYELKTHPSCFCDTGEIAFDEEDEDDIDLQDEEGLIINNNTYNFIEESEFNDEDNYIYERWDKMVIERDELKSKLKEATQGIPAYNGLIPQQNINGIVEGFRFLELV